MRILRPLFFVFCVGAVRHVAAETAFDNLDGPHDGRGWCNAVPEAMSAQAFNLRADNTVNSVTLRLNRFGQPNGTLSLNLYDDDDGKPGSLIGTLGQLDPQVVPTGQDGRFSFDMAVSDLTPDTTYYAVLSHDGTNWGRSDCVSWGMTSRNGADDAERALAIAPQDGIDWHTVTHFPTGGPPFSVWFYASIDTSFGSIAGGDFNGDGSLTTADIDALSRAISSPLAAAEFDLNHDDLVDLADHHHWVNELRRTWIGDSNLDGEFNSGDFIEVFQAGKYEVNTEAGWAEGDWNADLRFDSGDFVAAFQGGGYELGPRATVNAVPEPSCSILLLIGIISLRRFGTHR